MKPATHTHWVSAQKTGSESLEVSPLVPLRSLYHRGSEVVNVCVYNGKSLANWPWHAEDVCIHVPMRACILVTLSFALCFYVTVNFGKPVWKSRESLLQGGDHLFYLAFKRIKHGFMQLLFMALDNKASAPTARPKGTWGALAWAFRRVSSHAEMRSQSSHVDESSVSKPWWRDPIWIVFHTHWNTYICLL